MHRKPVHVSPDKRGVVIGRKGRTILQIKQETQTQIKSTEDGFCIYGHDLNQVLLAERQIKSIIDSPDSQAQSNQEFKQGSLLIQVPEDSVKTVIGRNGDKIKGIMDGTKTEIRMIGSAGSFYIKGDEDNQRRARAMIKDVACHGIKFFSVGELSWCKVLSFVDDKSIDSQADFELLPEDPLKPEWTVKKVYKVTAVEDGAQKVKSRDRFGVLKGHVLEVLRRLHEHCDTHVVDIWCLFGNAYITHLDEDEEGKKYTLKDIQEKLCSKENPWKSTFFKREINSKDLQEALTETSKVRYDRCAFSVLTPSFRNVRVKVFLKLEEDGSLSFYNYCPESLKGVIETVHSGNGGPSYFLCIPPHKNMKATIFCPLDELDYFLMIRTKIRTAKATTKEQEEENQVIIKFLNENLVIEDQKLKLLDKSSLPPEYDIDYWRQSRRTVFKHYEALGSYYSIKVTEEYKDQGSSVVEGDFVNDVQLRCNEWEKGFTAGEWNPEEIVENLPKFLSVVSEVHNNISFQQAELN